MFLLVTGGAGFIGSRLVHAAVECGHRVRVLDDLSTGERGRLPAGAGVDLHVGDVADAATTRAAAEGTEAILHLAAHRAVPRSIRTPLATDRANTHGTLAVLEAARAAGVGRVVVASSSSVYGAATTSPTPETTVPAPRSPYAVSKLAGEHYARVYGEVFGVSTLSLRLFNVYGPGQPADGAYAQLVPRFMAALAAGEPPTIHGDGRQARDLVFVDDVVGAFLSAVEHPETTGVLNVGSGRSTSVLEVLGACRLASGCTDGPAGQLAPAQAGDVPRTCADTTQAGDRLGWRALTPLEAGLRATWAAMAGTVR